MLRGVGLDLLTLVDLLDPVEGVDVCRLFVVPDPLDAREPQGVAAVVPVALLDAVEGHLEDDLRPHGHPEPDLAHRQPLDPDHHLLDLLVREPRVRLSYDLEAVPVPHREGVVAY